MLTPQDIQNKEFVKAVFGGYDMPSVDDFLEELTDDYAALYKENAVLKSKMKVLVEKVEEYRSTEDAMRMALLAAQKTGNNITKEAKEKSEAMLSEAEEKSRTMMEEATKKSTAMLSEAESKSRSMIAEADAIAKGKVSDLVELTKFENERLEKAIENSRQYINASKKMAEKQLQFLEKLSEIKAEPVEVPEYDFLRTDEYEEVESENTAEDVSVNEETDDKTVEAVKVDEKEAKENEILNTAQQIDENVSNMLNADTQVYQKFENSDNTGNNKKFRRKNSDIDWDDDDEPTSPRPKFDFTDLKFGKNFDIGDK